MPAGLKCFNLIIPSLLSALLSLTVSASCYAQLPENYQDLNADVKQNLLWDEITKSNAIDPLPKLSGNSFTEILAKIRGLFNLKPSFDHGGDEEPEGRVKILHVNGCVGKIAFLPAPNHPFTGIYKTGALGLARLSLATPPADKEYVPGIAVKFLIPHHESLNLQAIYSLEGQNENWNFFANNFSNQVPHPTGWTLKAIEKIFEWVRSPANDLPLWHVASWTNEGKFVSNVVYPERIYLKPSDRVKNSIPENSREDFRKSLSQLSTGPLYEVYGEYKNKEYYIGTLVLESSLLASNYGDKTLFFQHQR
jgi:hypothetical protein